MRLFYQLLVKFSLYSNLIASFPSSFLCVLSKVVYNCSETDVINEKDGEEK